MACCEYHCICGENFISNEKVCPRCGNTNVLLVGYDDIVNETPDYDQDEDEVDELYK